MKTRLGTGWKRGSVKETQDCVSFFPFFHSSKQHSVKDIRWHPTASGNSFACLLAPWAHPFPTFVSLRVLLLLPEIFFPFHLFHQSLNFFFILQESARSSLLGKSPQENLPQTRQRSGSALANLCFMSPA